MYNRIKELPEEQRPYEKCIREGERALSDGELLAVILKNGVSGGNSLTLANDILSYTQNTSFPGLQGLLHLSLEQLRKIHGIGKVKAVQLKCIGELSRRIASESMRAQVSFNQPLSIAKYYMERLRHEEQELLISMMFDTKNHLLGDQILSRGTVNASLITPREIYVEALRRHAVCLTLVHNHPSGDPTPSESDRILTRRVFEAGEMLGVHLLDHIVIGDHRYVSFHEEGLMDGWRV